MLLPGIDNRLQKVTIGSRDRFLLEMFGKKFLWILVFICLLPNLICWNTASTKEVILGTNNGQLYEMAVDEKDKREKYVKLLFELAELPEAFMGLQVLFLFFFFLES